MNLIELLIGFKKNFYVPTTPPIVPNWTVIGRVLSALHLARHNPAYVYIGISREGDATEPDEISDSPEQIP